MAKRSAKMRASSAAQLTPPPKGPYDQAPHLLFLQTTNRDKLREYQEIFDKQRNPVIVLPINILTGTFHEAIEDGGSVEDNAKQKLYELEPTIELLKFGHYHRGSKIVEDKAKQQIYWRRLTDFLTQYRIVPADTDPASIPEKLHHKDNPLAQYLNTHVHFAVEDSSVGVSGEVWKQVDKHGIPEETLARVENALELARLGNEKEWAPAAEFAPVIASIGGDEFMRRVFSANLRVAQEKALPADQAEIVQAKLQSRMMYVSLEAAQFDNEGKLYQPNAADAGRVLKFNQTPTLGGSDHPLTINAYFHHVAPENSDNWERWLSHSPRASVAREFARELGHLKIDKRVTSPKPFRITEFLGAGAGETNKGSWVKSGLAPKDVTWQSYTPGSRTSREKFPLDGSSELASRFYETLRYVEGVVQKSDAVVLTGFEEAKGLSKKQRFHNHLMLNSLVVAKTLIPRDMLKPVIVQNVLPKSRKTGNEKGCWQDAIDQHYHMVANQMAKDTSIDPTELLTDKLKENGIILPPGVKLADNDYFTTLTGPSEAVGEATKQLLDFYKAHYLRVDTDNSTTVKEFSPELKDQFANRFKVGIFLSATSENVQLMESTERLVAHLCDHGLGIVYGGGDRHLMGAVYQGARKWMQRPENHNKAMNLEAYSTPDILMRESERGEFPPEVLHGEMYGKLCHDIYHRLADMMAASDVLVFMPGGAGTMQELYAALLLQQYHPEEMKDKPIIIYNPKLYHEGNAPYYDSILDRTTNGERHNIKQDIVDEQGQTLTLHYKKIGKDRIYIVDDEATAQALIHKFQLEKSKKLSRPSPASGASSPSRL